MGVIVASGVVLGPFWWVLFPLSFEAKFSAESFPFPEHRERGRRIKEKRKRCTDRVGIRMERIRALSFFLRWRRDQQCLFGEPVFIFRGGASSKIAVAGSNDD